MTKLPRGTFFIGHSFCMERPDKTADDAHGVLHKSQLKLPAVLDLETELAQPTGRAEHRNLLRRQSAWGVGRA